MVINWLTALPGAETMSSPTTPNPLSIPVALRSTQVNQPKSLAVSRGDSTILAVLGSMMLALAVIMGVSMTGASGPFQDILRSVKAALAPDDALVAEQERHAAAIAALERRIHAVTAELGTMTSRAQQARYHDAAVSDRFSTLETDVAALTAELRAVRTARPDAEATHRQVDFLEATLVEVGGGVMALRSSFDAFAESHRKDIADLAATQRKDIAAITSRVERIEQAIAARDITSSIPTQVRKKKARKRRPTSVARATVDSAPFQPVPSPFFPGPVAR